MAAPDKCPRGNGGQKQKETHIKAKGAVFVILSEAKDLDAGDVIPTHRLIMRLLRLDSSLYCVTLRMTNRTKYLQNKSL
jgi:hypothetical protein